MNLWISDLSVLLTAIAMIATKFMDCKTTTDRISHPMQERNPFARRLMQKYGIHKVVWIIFAISILLVAIALWLLYHYYNNLAYKLSFCLMGLLVSAVQFAVAASNKSGRLNAITRLLIKFYDHMHI